MEIKSRKLVYDGVNEVMNGKIAFMEQCMRFPATREMIVKRLSEDEKLRKKLHCITTDRVKEKIHHMILTGKDLVLLYDALYEARVNQFIKDTEDPYMLRCALPMQLDGTKLELDVTYLIVYGMMINPRCRKALHAEIDAWADLMEYYEKSGYKNRYFEKCFQMEDVWDARALVGLLEKMRNEREEGKSYQFLMKIIYAGYGYMKRSVKSLKCITGCWIKDYLQDTFNRTRNMVSIVSKIFILLVIAEDIEIPYVWDFEMLVMFRSFQEFQEEMECGIAEHTGLQLYKNVNYHNFLEEFDKSYKTHNSLFDLLQQENEDPMGDLLIRVMSMYEVNPRKFWKDELSEKEIEYLMRQSSTWDLKSYWHMLVVAQLCKYIQKMEDQYMRLLK